MQDQVSLLLAGHENKLSFVQVKLYFASDFQSFAGAPISFDVLLHVLEVVLQLLDPVRSSCGSDRQLVPVVPDVEQDQDRGTIFRVFWENKSTTCQQHLSDFLRSLLSSPLLQRTTGSPSLSNDKS